MAKIYLGLGSNVGDRLSHIRKACGLLKQQVRALRASNVYDTNPVGYEAQENFLNLALEGETDLQPLALLDFTEKVEMEIGRVNRFRWGPREIDIDILLYDDLVYKDARLEIPHPRMHERDFVLKPLVDLDPMLMHPVLKKTVGELYAEFPKNKSCIINHVNANLF